MATKRKNSLFSLWKTRFHRKKAINRETLHAVYKGGPISDYDCKQRAEQIMRQ